jgi:hypothetical protein
VVGLLPVSRHPAVVAPCHPPPPLPSCGASTGSSPTFTAPPLKGTGRHQAEFFFLVPPSPREEHAVSTLLRPLAACPLWPTRAPPSPPKLMLPLLFFPLRESHRTSPTTGRRRRTPPPPPSRRRPTTCELPPAQPCPAPSPCRTRACAANLSAREPPPRSCRPRHHGWSSRGDHRVHAPCWLGPSRRFWLLGQAEPARPWAESGPTLCTIFRVFIFFYNSRNSYEILKYV